MAYMWRMKSLVLPPQVERRKYAGTEEEECRYRRGGMQVQKRRSAGCYFTILGKMKIAENEGRRYGTAGHVGQLSSANCSTLTMDLLMNWASEYLYELKLASMLVDPEVHISGPRSAGHSSKSHTSAYSPSTCVPFPI
jgi:hypothetical protein